MSHSSELCLLILVVITLVAAQKDRCEEGWSPLTGKNANPFRCGKFISDRMTFNDAIANCESITPKSGRNGELATVPDRSTNRRLTEIIRAAARGPYMAWIGLRRGEENEDGETFFQWVNYGRLRRFENWAPDTPNNDKTRGGQDCVYINDYRKEGTWNDFECQTLFQSVCQYEPLS